MTDGSCGRAGVDKHHALGGVAVERVGQDRSPPALAAHEPRERRHAGEGVERQRGRPGAQFDEGHGHSVSSRDHPPPMGTLLSTRSAR